MDRLTEQQLEQAIDTINDDPTTITIVDNNGIDNQTKTEINETPNTNETSNNGDQIRRSSRIRSNIPIEGFGNPLTHQHLQRTPLKRSVTERKSSNWPERKDSEQK